MALRTSYGNGRAKLQQALEIISLNHILNTPHTWQNETDKEFYRIVKLAGRKGKINQGSSVHAITSLWQAMLIRSMPMWAVYLSMSWFFDMPRIIYASLVLKSSERQSQQKFLSLSKYSNVIGVFRGH